MTLKTKSPRSNPWGYHIYQAQKQSHLLLFKDFSFEECGQDTDGVFDEVCDHPGFEEPAGNVLTACLALVLASTHAFAALCNLKVQTLQVVAAGEREV